MHSLFLGATVRILPASPHTRKRLYQALSLFGSAGRIRTYDQSVTLILLLPEGVDYIISRKVAMRPRGEALPACMITGRTSLRIVSTPCPTIGLWLGIVLRLRRVKRNRTRDFPDFTSFSIRLTTESCYFRLNPSTMLGMTYGHSRSLYH